MATTAIRVLLVEDNPGDVVLIRGMLAEGASDPFELTAVERLATARAEAHTRRFEQPPPGSASSAQRSGDRRCRVGARA